MPDKKEKMIQVCFRIPETVKDAFHITCIHNKTKMQVMIKRWVRDYIAEHQE